MDCNCLIHPFQNDPGVSQRQRVMEELLSGAAKIDARSLADLLDFFMQMSVHINYYDLDMKVGNWQPFFQKSAPFTLAAIIKYRSDQLEDNFALYNSLFNKNPSASGLQLTSRFIYYHFIHRVNTWYSSLKDSKLPISSRMELLMRDKFQQHVKSFISISNAASASFGVRRIDFLPLLQNNSWNLSQQNLSAIDTGHKKIRNRHKRLHYLNDSFRNLFPPLVSSIRQLSIEAEKSLEQSILQKKEELQQLHQPHLALVFAFLNIFGQLQDDLNGFSRKHLDYFYRDILQFKPSDAKADRAHVLFEIQTQLKKYLLRKGLLLKGGKDDKKQEILFGLGSEIVVNRTEIAEKKSLFLNNQIVRGLDNGAIRFTNYVEGAYVADDATKADGVAKEFDGDIKNFPTVGSRLSKYVDPVTRFAQPHPNARIGLVIASPVLLLEGGKRTIDLHLACHLENSVCDAAGKEIAAASANCCNPERGAAKQEGDVFPDFKQAADIFPDVRTVINKKFIYLSETLLQAAQMKGFSKEIIAQIRDRFLAEEGTEKLCYCDVKTYRFENSVLFDVWDPFIQGIVADLVQRAILDKIFPPLKIFRLSFSSEEDWLVPEPDDYTLSMSPMAVNGNFLLSVHTSLDASKPPVSKFNKEKLKEELSATDPLVKIELDDRLKLKLQLNNPEGGCCLDRIPDDQWSEVSFYHLFRNVTVIKSAGGTNTGISVEVCGLNKFIVQNDEGLQDTKAPVYPFGARPDIIDYNVVNPSKTYYLTPQVVIDAQPINAATTNFLNGKLAGQPRYYIGITDKDLDDFIALIPVAADRNKIKNLLKDPSKNYANQNLIGPSFYIGSGEIFCKNWKDLWININWKEKPNSFNDYYKAYVLRENGGSKIYGLDESEFQVNMAVLDDGVWRLETSGGGTNGRVQLNSRTAHFNRQLFLDDRVAGVINNCAPLNQVQQVFEVRSRFFNHAKKFRKCDVTGAFVPGTRNGFIKLTLENQDFLHKEYAFVLARQMMALGRLPEVALEGAIYIEHPSNNIISFKGSIVAINQILTDLNNVETLSDTARTEVESIIASLNNATAAGSAGGATITAGEINLIAASINQIIASNSAIQLEIDIDALVTKMAALQALFSFFDINGKVLKPLEVPIPNEPYTPVIRDIFLDYTAEAGMDDMELLHLYPFKNTYKQESITLQPSLLPVYCDEGTLFLGLKGLEPGTNLNILFQLAEATADSESEKQEVRWYYLENNIWKSLRKGFEVIEDGTANLTTSGIVKLALPSGMTSTNTVMRQELYWIKAAIGRNSRSVSESTGIHPQAIEVVFTNTDSNDKLRLSKPLAAGSIAKLNEADASIKSVQQPYESFGGRLPETEGSFYVRVSETLRHKGRAIQPWDYERLVLEEFPQLYKAKCISHTFPLDGQLYKNDFPYAPGYVVLALIPDLSQLKAGNSFEPRVPVSILEKVDRFIRRRTSPFVRFRAMNPRYEKVNFCIKVQLHPGRDENFYREKLKEELSRFLAPWSVGEYHKLSFGECVYRSDIIRFLETRDYVDFIVDLRMGRQDEIPDDKIPVICPDTARSILVSGYIEVCIQTPECEEWSRDFNACGDKPILDCDNKPIPFGDHCKR